MDAHHAVFYRLQIPSYQRQTVRAVAHAVRRDQGVSNRLSLVRIHSSGPFPQMKQESTR